MDHASLNDHQCFLFISIAAFKCILVNKRPVRDKRDYVEGGRYFAKDVYERESALLLIDIRVQGAPEDKAR